MSDDELNDILTDVQLSTIEADHIEVIRKSDPHTLEINNVWSNDIFLSETTSIDSSSSFFTNLNVSQSSEFFYLPPKLKPLDTSHGPKILPTLNMKKKPNLYSSDIKSKKRLKRLSDSEISRYFTLNILRKSGSVINVGGLDSADKVNDGDHAPTSEVSNGEMRKNTVVIVLKKRGGRDRRELQCQVRRCPVIAYTTEEMDEHFRDHISGKN